MVWQERRSSFRHVIELPIRYRILDSASNKAHKVQLSAEPLKTQNISENGLLFLSSEFFESGTVLELTLPVKDKIFTMEGRVVHTSRDPESGMYRTGIYFSRLDQVFKLKMAEQVHLIHQYRSMLSQEEGRVVSEQEAAERWIEEHSHDFAKFYK